MYIKVETIDDTLENIPVLPVTVQKLDRSCYIYDIETKTVKYLDVKDDTNDGNNFAVPVEYADNWFITDGQNSVFDGQKVRLAE